MLDGNGKHFFGKRPKSGTNKFAFRKEKKELGTKKAFFNPKFAKNRNIYLLIYKDRFNYASSNSRDETMFCNPFKVLSAFLPSNGSENVTVTDAMNGDYRANGNVRKFFSFVLIHKLFVMISSLIRFPFIMLSLLLRRANFVVCESHTIPYCAFYITSHIKFLKIISSHFFFYIIHYFFSSTIPKRLITLITITIEPNFKPHTNTLHTHIYPYPYIYFSFFVLTLFKKTYP